MPKLTLIQKDGSEKEITAESGWSLMEILRDEGISEIEGACGGSMACATCHIYVHPKWNEIVGKDNEQTEEEEDMLDIAFNIEDSSRLGCQIRMSDELDGIIVAVPGAKVKW